jgi:predicted nucleic acid-binding protein
MDNVHISTQVLNQTTNVLAKKYSISWGDLAKLIDDFEKNIPVHLVMISEIRKSCGISERYGFSFFDSLMIASALECNCDILYSEDMQNGQIIQDKLKIVNPFL